MERPKNLLSLLYECDSLSTYLRANLRYLHVLRVLPHVRTPEHARNRGPHKRKLPHWGANNVVVCALCSYQPLSTNITFAQACRGGPRRARRVNRYNADVFVQICLPRGARVMTRVVLSNKFTTRYKTLINPTSRGVKRLVFRPNHLVDSTAFEQRMTIAVVTKSEVVALPGIILRFTHICRPLYSMHSTWSFIKLLCDLHTVKK